MAIGFTLGLAAGFLLTRFIIMKEAQYQQRKGFWTPKRGVFAAALVLWTIVGTWLFAHPLDYLFIRDYLAIGFTFGLVAGSLVTKYIIIPKEAQYQQKNGLWTPKRKVGVVGLSLWTILFALMLAYPF